MRETDLYAIERQLDALGGLAPGASGTDHACLRSYERDVARHLDYFHELRMVARLGASASEQELLSSPEAVVGGWAAAVSRQIRIVFDPELLRLRRLEDERERLNRKQGATMARVQVQQPAQAAGAS